MKLMANLADKEIIVKKIEEHINLYKTQNAIFERAIEALCKKGAKLYLVGGAIRDICLGLENYDIDIEVHKLSLEEVKKALENIGHVRLVGKSFGVLKIDGLDVDWSLPRIDSSGRKPEVSIVPNLDIEQALKRRDLKINAMAFDILKKELIDPFGGLENIKNKILSTPDPSFFIEDPLRFFRVMQFISRFEFYPDQELNNLCKSMDISAVSKERIEAEFKKLFLKSRRPSLGIRWLRDISKLKDILPELFDTIGIKQDPIWHPEGDVFEHSMQALDAAALYTPNDNKRLLILVSALCHDLGKALTTKFVKGRWHSYNHAPAGVPLATSLLNRITTNQDLIRDVRLLVRYHMEPLSFIKNSAKLPAYKKLAKKIGPYVNLKSLSHLLRADRLGRNGDSNEPLRNSDELVQEFIQRAKDAKVYEHALEPVVTGKDLIDRKLVEPGPKLGKLLDQAYEIQLKYNIEDKERLIKMLFKSK